MPTESKLETTQKEMNPQVRVAKETKEKLDRAKIHPRETYDDVIKRLLDMAE